MKDVESLIRQELLSLKPYSSARDEFHGTAEIYVDANENPFENGINRYPDPLQRALKSRISEIKQVKKQNIFLGNGSDEVLDLIIRLFCVPGKDGIIITPPTYGMYKVLGNINDVFVKEAPLNDDFQLDLGALMKSINRETKILFLCTPNNPVGNLLNSSDVMQILQTFPGIVVIDEAYIDFANTGSYAQLIEQYNRLIVIQTLSKAWGMAGIRLGMAFTNEFIVNQLNKIKPPYNVNILTQQKALEELSNVKSFTANVKSINSERIKLHKILSALPMVKKVYESEANFILAEFDDAEYYYNMFLQNGIVVRNRSSQYNCYNCLRITIGTPKENKRIMDLLKKIIKS